MLAGTMKKILIRDSSGQSSTSLAVNEKPC
jgi:hypothetical protein